MRNMSFRLPKEAKNKHAENQATLAGKTEYRNHCTFSGLLVSLFLAECDMCMNILSYKIIHFTEIPLYDSVLIGCHNH